MTPFDDLYNSLAAEVSASGPDHLSLVLLAAGRALRPLYDDWATQTQSINQSDLLDEAQRVLTTGNQASSLRLLKERLEEQMPWGEAIRGVPSADAQTVWEAHWLAADAVLEPLEPAVRFVEPPLQPVLIAASERLFGVSDVGSGPHEAPMQRQILGEPDVVRAIEWFRDALARPNATLSELLAPDPHPLMPS